MVADALSRKSRGVLARCSFLRVADARSCRTVQSTVERLDSRCLRELSGYAFPTK